MRIIPTVTGSHPAGGVSAGKWLVLYFQRIILVTGWRLGYLEARIEAGGPVGRLLEKSRTERSDTLHSSEPGGGGKK